MIVSSGIMLFKVKSALLNYFVTFNIVAIFLFFLAIPCKPPNTTKHVKSLNESTNQYRTGDKIVLECKPGYRGIGNGTVECYEGNWTSQGFFCESKSN